MFVIGLSIYFWFTESDIFTFTVVLKHFCLKCSSVNQGSHCFNIGVYPFVLIDCNWEFSQDQLMPSQVTPIFSLSLIAQGIDSFLNQYNMGLSVCKCNV